MNTYADENKRHFRFEMTDSDGDRFCCEEDIEDYDFDLEDELDYLLEKFKRFLLFTGWSQIQVSRLQYLEDDEWKEVLTRYGEWINEKEICYQYRKEREDAIQ